MTNRFSRVDFVARERRPAVGACDRSERRHRAIRGLEDDRRDRSGGRTDRARAAGGMRGQREKHDDREDRERRAGFSPPPREGRAEARPTFGMLSHI